MRRFLFMLFLCIHWLAQAQTPYEYRYWFDGDASTVQSGTQAGAAWRMDLDVSGLKETFHLFHFQVKDTAGVWSSPHTRCFVRIPIQGNVRATYWFNDDEANKQTVASANGVAALDVSSLRDGFHLLHVTADVAGSTHNSIVKTAFFLKQSSFEQGKYRLWIDDNRTVVQEGTYTGKPIALDVADISEGFHVIRAQVGGTTESSPITTMFLKVPQVIGVEYLTAVFLVDGKEYKQEQLPTEGGILKWTFDASGIPHGLHKVQAMVLTPTGAATGVKDAFFYRAMTTAEKGAMRCFYSIDGSPHQYEAGRMENNLFHFDLDVAEVEDGFHRISYMLMGENGTSSRVMSAFFIKTPIGGNGVMQYDYWLNENEENMKRVKLEKRENPFKLISLLPVETCPIRTTSFHFEAKDGVPVIYAKNDFHVRFYDVAGRLTEASKSYVDYNVSQPVEDIEHITDKEGIINCDKPNENDILWFKMDAKIGDSLAIKTSQAATLQIFSPSGQEVYNAGGAESVNFSGCHAYEDGTFYIALHDVKGTSGTTIDLHYQHIDKYALLKWTPNEIGAAVGYVHVDLFGNGYDKLKSAALVHGTDSIKADTVVIKDGANATIECFISNSEMTKGDYDIVLEFEDNGTQERLIKEKAIKLADPVYGDIKIEVSSQRRTAKPYPVTIKVTNTGNVGYQMIPFYVGFTNPHLIDEVYAMNFGVYISEESLGNGTDVPTFIQTNNLLNKGIDGFVLPTIIPKLDANETIELQLGFVAGPQTKFDLYAWSYSPWGLYNINDVAPSSAMRKAGRARPNPTCQMDPCEIASQVIPNWAECVCGIAWGNISALAGGHLAQYNKWARQMNDIYGAELDYYGISRYEEVQLRSPGDILRNVMEHCVHMPNEVLQALYDAMNNMAEDDCPTPDPHPVDVYMPGDPNDIKGYTAPSGSKYVPKEMTDAYYAIEFENDPKIANAAAHHIIIKDTLDGRYHDLSSFAPTSIKFNKKDIMLDGEQSFVRTVDLRPETNVIAQLSLDYDEKKGIATWDFLALDPMTMEPTDHAMMGILPVNNENGDGQGEVTFDIKLKENLDDGTEIHNRASIIFDQEAPIITPTWINVVDTIAPMSKITASETVSDSTVVLHFSGTDNRSGVWAYDLYVQKGTDDPWEKVAEHVTDSVYEHTGFTGFNYGYCVLATDSAGNVEHKELVREISPVAYQVGDANGDGVIDITDVTAIQYYIHHGLSDGFNEKAADANEDGVVDITDITTLIYRIHNGTNKVRASRMMPQRIVIEDVWE